MKLKRILALAVSLAMVLSIVPAFSLTAGAAVESYAAGAEWFAIDFDLTSPVTAFADIGITDADGDVFTAFCTAWMTNDGFYFPDGERQFQGETTDGAAKGNWATNGLYFLDDYSSKGNKRISYTGTNKIAYTSNATHIRIVVDQNTTATPKTYTVSYYVNGSQTAHVSAEYEGTVNGVQNYSGWVKSQGDGTFTCSNFIVTSDKNAVYNTSLTSYKAYAGEAKFTATSQNTDTPVTAYGDGWSASFTGTLFQSGTTMNINASGTALQFFGPAGSSDTLTMPGYGVGNDFVILDYTLGRSTANFLNYLTFKDNTGKEIEKIYVNRTDSNADTSYNAGSAEAGFGVALESDYEKLDSGYNNGVRMVFANDTDNNKYYVSYYTYGPHNIGAVNEKGTNSSWEESSTGTEGWQKVYTSVHDGSFDGLKSIYATCAASTTWSNNCHFANLTIYAGDFPTAATVDTVQFALNNNITVPALAKDKVTLPKTTTEAKGETVNITWAATPTGVINLDTGAVTTPDEITKVTLTPTGTVGTEITATGKDYTVTVLPKSLAGGTYTAPADDYNGANGVTFDIGTTSLASLADLTDATGAAISASTGWTASTDGSDVTYYTTTGAGDSNSANSVKTNLKAKLNTDTLYLAVLTWKNLPSGGYTGIWTGSSVSTAIASFAGESDPATDTWTREAVMFNTESHETINLLLAWLRANSTSVAEFELFTLTPQASATAATLTIKYQDADGTPLKADDVIDKNIFVGSSYSFNPPTTLIYSNKVYALTSNTTITTTLTANSEVIVNYAVPSYRTVDVPANFTVGDKIYEPVTGATNLIDNPSFETTDGTFSMIGWRAGDGTWFTNAQNNNFYMLDGTNNKKYYANESTVGTGSAQTDGASDGQWALMSRYNQDQNNASSISTNFYVGANKTVCFSYYVKALTADDCLVTVDAVSSIDAASVGDKTSEGKTDWIATDASNNNGNVATVATDWTQVNKIVTTTDANPYVQFNAFWLGGAGDSNASFAFDKFVLTEVEEAKNTYNVTVEYYYDDAQTDFYTSVTKPVKEGATAQFEAISEFVHNGRYYSKAALEYANVTAAATYKVTLDVNSTKYAATQVFDWDFTTGTQDSGNTVANTARATGWGNDLRVIVADIPVSDASKAVKSATLNLTVERVNSSDSMCYTTVYAIDANLVTDGALNIAANADYKYDTMASTLADIGATAVSTSVSLQNSAGQLRTIDIDLSKLTVKGEVALLVVCTSGGQYAIYDDTDPAKTPYLSNITYADTVVYNIAYVDNNNSTITADVDGKTLADLKIDTTAEYAEGTQYGYNNEVVCPNLYIPTIKGYVFDNKTVSGNTITLTYYPALTTDYFFDNITDMNTRFVSLNMLGSHDAFASKVSENRYDAAGIKQGNGSAKTASVIVGGSISTNTSVSQDLTARGQLEAGARYFDIRLSRSETDASAGIGYYNAPHTNGVLYTVHGLLFNEFEPELYAISQWAAQHPGEVIVLDVQEYFDYNSGYDGNATAQSWRDLDAMLRKAGIYDYVTIGNGSIKTVTYGDLTAEGTKAGIVLFGRHTAINDKVGSFILRGGTTHAYEGSLYSTYQKKTIAGKYEGTPFGEDESKVIGTSFKASFIQAQVDYLATYNTGYYTYTNDKGEVVTLKDETGDYPIYWMFRVMQAQCESTNLIKNAATENSDLYSGLLANPEWLTALPVVMVNGVGHNTADIVKLLKECNVPTVSVEYVLNGTVVKTVENAALVGTLYTNDGFYSEPLYKLVNNADGEYYVTETFYTAPYNGAITEVVKDSTVQVDVAQLGTVYTIENTRDSSKVHIVNNGYLDDNKLYSCLTNFAAYTWDNTKYRLGVAILDADPNSSAYMLTATEVRKYFNSDAGVTKFYAIPLETYRALDLRDSGSLAALLTDDNLVGTVNHGNCRDVTALGAINLALDTTKMKAAVTSSTSNKVVIIGDSWSGLYGLSSDIAIAPAWKVTVDGTENIVKNQDPFTATAATDAIAFVDGNRNVCALTDGTYTIPNVTADMTLTSDGMFVELVPGAQVRYGQGVDSNGKIKESTGTDDATAGSGLRFIATVTTTSPLAQAGLERGLAITAEGDTTNTLYVPATTYQNVEGTVFSVALVNLLEGNYNRVFTATPYVKIGTDYITAGTPVSRSIYEIAAGLLVDSTKIDGATENPDFAVDEAINKVLNAYVNQVGIRLTLASVTTDAVTARTGETETGKYNGGKGTTPDVFFTVTTGAYNSADKSYTIRIEAKGNAKFADFWDQYIRINNNTTFVQANIETIEKTDTAIEFKFYPKGKV